MGIGLVPLLDILRHGCDVSLSIASAVAPVQWGSTAGKCGERRLAAQAVDATEQEFELSVRTRTLILGNHVTFSVLERFYNHFVAHIWCFKLTPKAPG